MKVYVRLCDMSKQKTEIKIKGVPISNNISILNNQDLTKKTNNTKNIFLLGITKLNQKSTFADDNNVNYFISNVVSNELGEFIEDCIFNISANSRFVCIYFDVINNEYPTELYANNILYTLNSPIFVVPTLDEKVYIRISKWNKPNKPLIVTSILPYFEIENFVEIETQKQDRRDTKYPSWGIKSNTGNIKFYDSHNILSQFKKLQLSQELTTKIFLCNNNNQKQHIFKFIVKNIDTIKQYERSIVIGDALENWQKIQVDFTIFVDDKVISADKYIEYVMKKAIDNNFSIYDLCDNETVEYLKNFMLMKPYIQNGSLWSVMQKICEATGCYIFDEEGNPKMHYGGGS